MAAPAPPNSYLPWAPTQPVASNARGAGVGGLPGAPFLDHEREHATHRSPSPAKSKAPSSPSRSPVPHGMPLKHQTSGSLQHSSSSSHTVSIGSPTIGQQIALHGPSTGTSTAGPPSPAHARIDVEACQRKLRQLLGSEMRVDAAYRDALMASPSHIATVAFTLRGSTRKPASEQPPPLFLPSTIGARKGRATGDGDGDDSSTGGGGGGSAGSGGGGGDDDGSTGVVLPPLPLGRGSLANKSSRKRLKKFKAQRKSGAAANVDEAEDDDDDLLPPNEEMPEIVQAAVRACGATRERDRPAASCTHTYVQCVSPPCRHRASHIWQAHSMHIPLRVRLTACSVVIARRMRSDSDTARVLAPRRPCSPA